MNNKKNIFWLGFTSLLTDISSEMILSLLPLFMTALGASRTIIGLIEGIAESTASILKVFSGWISDKLDLRKELVVFGYALSTAFKPFIALANFWPQVLFVRFVDRVGKGIRTAPRDALVVDSVDASERGRAFGFQRSMDTFGAVIGTFSASALLFILGNHTNLGILEQYRTIFWLSVIPGVLAVLVVGFLVKDVKQKNELNGKVFLLKSINADFKKFLFVSAVFEFSNFSYAIFILRASNLGVVTALIPIIYLLYNLIYGFLSQPLGILSDKIGKKKLLLSGYVLASIMCLGFGYSFNSFHAWILFCIYGIISAITNTVPRALLADVVPPQIRASAYGLYYMILGFVALPTSAVAGFLWDKYGPVIAFNYGAVLALLAALLLLLLIPKDKKIAS